MSENNIGGIMDTAMEKLRAVVDADTIIGTPVVVGKITLIPVSKVSLGIATGGSDFGSKSPEKNFGGGAGAGVSVTPIAFISVNGENVHMLPVASEMTGFDKALNMAPEIIDKIKSLFKEDKYNLPKEDF